MLDKDDIYIYIYCISAQKFNTNNKNTPFRTVSRTANCSPSFNNQTINDNQTNKWLWVQTSLHFSCNLVSDSAASSFSEAWFQRIERCKIKRIHPRLIGGCNHLRNIRQSNVESSQIEYLKSVENHQPSKRSV